MYYWRVLCVLAERSQCPEKTAVSAGMILADLLKYAIKREEWAEFERMAVC
jgi:hypothetical protein